ncbi:MAG TPA: hypothetical protein VEX68_20430 [Bryobacteraceae bacterium]|nr:hypothetical protein [Bryobacteraceae bacterium]
MDILILYITKLLLKRSTSVFGNPEGGTGNAAVRGAISTLGELTRSANLDKTVTGLESLQQTRPQSPKQVKKKDAATVADPNPDQASVRIL